MFQDKTYSLIGINPIFSYIPSKTIDYPIFKKSPKERVATILLKDFKDNPNFIIKVFWANANFWINKNDGIILTSKNDTNISSIKFKGEKQDGSIVEYSIPQKPIMFGNQVFYFDVKKIKREGFNEDFENIILYKPQKEVDITKHVKEKLSQYVLSLKQVKQQGCCLARNKKDGSYVLSY